MLLLYDIILYSIMLYYVQTTEVFDRHLHSRELQGVFSSLAELFFQVSQGKKAYQVLIKPNSKG